MRPIDGDKLMMSLADWWFSSFGDEETQEAKAIRTVMDKVEDSLQHFELSAQSEPCEDAVSRNAALGCLWSGQICGEFCRKAIQELPPIDTVHVVRCGECRHNNDCDIQYIAQAGDNFYCGCGEQKG